MWSNAQQSYSVVDSPWRLPNNVLSEKLREEVWCAISPVSHGIQRTRDEILDSKLTSLREFRRACLSYLEPRLAAFRKSERFEYVGRKLLNLTLIPDPDPRPIPALENKPVDNTLSKLPIVYANEEEAVINTDELSGKSEKGKSYNFQNKDEGENSSSSTLSSEQDKNKNGDDFRSLPLGRRMLIYKPMPWTLKRPDKGDAVELSRKTGKKDHQKPKRGNIVGKEVWVTLQIGKNELGRHKSCGVVLHTDQRCSRVHGVVPCSVQDKK